LTTTKLNKRLTRNFHSTFKPERQYINALLRFSGAGGSGDFIEIANSTGIPMGSSSGKVPAILDYCRGMGMVRLSDKSKKSAKKVPELTNFGRIVLLEDPYLKCEITQWLAHFNLCSPFLGAEVWYHTFFTGYYGLGDKFKRTELENYLNLQFGINDSNLIGPMIGMYEDEAAFGLCGALSENNGMISRKSAPIFDELGRGYAAWILQLAKDYFPSQRQIPIDDFDKIVGWKTIPGWSDSASLEVLALIEKKGLIRVDRHMKPWLLQVQVDTEVAWKCIYSDMI